MVAPNARLLKAFPLVRCVVTRSGDVVPERLVRDAANRGILNQLEAWLDFYENQRPGNNQSDVPGTG